VANIGSLEGEIKVMGVVRDKEGNPKFDSGQDVTKFWDVLSDKDKAYLTEKYDLKEK